MNRHRPDDTPPSRRDAAPSATATAMPTVVEVARRPSMRARRDRLALRALAVLGLVWTWHHNLAYFAGGGSVAPGVFWRDATANALTTAITVDVYVAAVAFAFWVLRERRVARPWLDVAACFGLGLAFALPWYLARRREDAFAPAPAAC